MKQFIATIACFVAFSMNSQVDRVLVNGNEIHTSLNLLELESIIETMQAEIATLQAQVVANLSDYVTVNPSTNQVVISGANFQVNSGTGATHGAVNGLGNIIIGYNEDENYDNSSEGGTPDPTPDVKTGSHNLIVGAGHYYTSFGGIIAGYDNKSTAKYTGALGGHRNIVSGDYSVTLGGDSNNSGGRYGSILGGFSNSIDAYCLGSVILGGYANETKFDVFSTISGGLLNKAEYSNTISILGGSNITKGGVTNTILGNLTSTHLMDSNGENHRIQTTACVEIILDSTTPDSGAGGAINITVNTANGEPFSVSWSGPNSFTSTSEDITGLPAGTYIVTVVNVLPGDNSGLCEATLSVDIL